MFGECYAKQLKNIPLSNHTICRRINDISVDIQQQLESELVGKLFAIQLDEATDSSNDSHLICYIRFCQGAAIVEDLLFCKPIEELLSSCSELQMMLLSAQTCSGKIVLEFAPMELKPCLVDITVYKHL